MNHAVSSLAPGLSWTNVDVSIDKTPETPNYDDDGDYYYYY